MAPTSKRWKSSPAQLPVKTKLPTPSLTSQWIRPSVIGVIILLLVCLSFDAMNQGGISCFFPKHYSLQLVGRIRGENLSCGGFKVGGMGYVKGGKIAVSDTDHHRLL